MKKVVRIISLSLLCIVVFALCGCSNVKDESVLEAKIEATEQSMMAFAGELEKYRGMSDEQVQEYVDTIESYKKKNQITEEKAKANEDVIKAWHEIEGEIGTFEEFGEFEFDSAGKTYTATLSIVYSNRVVKLVYTISKNDFEVTGANVDVEYTLGERMSKAGLNTLMGIGIVFLMLVLMCIVIYAFNIISIIQARHERKKEMIEIARFEGDEDDSGDENVTSTDDEQLIAVIAAAIAASTGVSTDDFVVRSIRRRS